MYRARCYSRGGGGGCLIFWPKSERLSRGRCLSECGLFFEEIRYMQFRACKVALFSRKQVKSVGAMILQRISD